MLKLLSEFLHSPGDFFQDERRQRIVIISLFSLLFVCILFTLAKGADHRRDASGDLDVTSTPLGRAPTQTKWWVKHKPSETPTSLIPSRQTQIGGPVGYISLFPPYENIARSGAGKNYSSVGFIEIGGWVKILAEPVCADDGYVWLNVQSAAGSSNWTAGGHKTAQWVIACPNPDRKCSKNKPIGSISATPNPNNNGNIDGDGNNPNSFQQYRSHSGY